VLNEAFRERLQGVEQLILSEVNVKELEYLDDTAGVLVKKIKPNFKTLGPRYGKLMKQIAAPSAFTEEDIARMEADGKYLLDIEGEEVEVLLSDVEIISEDIPGWLVANEGTLTVALDVTITRELKEEGIARELINRIQNLRKEKGFEVTDKIDIILEAHEEISQAILNNNDYICSETLARNLSYQDSIEEDGKTAVDLTDDIQTYVLINKVNNN
jgi:isoleucyl-tRNA synthetase